MKDVHRSASPSQLISLVFLRHANQVPVVTNQKSLISDIERLARQFFDFYPTEQLKYFTKFDDELVRIDPAAWPSIYHFVTSIWIETSSNRPSSVTPQEVHSPLHSPRSRSSHCPTPISIAPQPLRHAPRPLPRTSDPWGVVDPQPSLFAAPTVDIPPQLIFLRRANRVPLVTSKKSSISDIEHIARQIFSFSPYEQLKFLTKFDDEELVRIDPAAWASIYHVITSVWIETAYAPPTVSPRKVYSPERSPQPDDAQPGVPFEGVRSPSPSGSSRSSALSVLESALSWEPPTRARREPGAEAAW